MYKWIEDNNSMNSEKSFPKRKMSLITTTGIFAVMLIARKMIYNHDNDLLVDHINISIQDCAI